jgi:hypothetical protein
VVHARARCGVLSRHQEETKESLHTDSDGAVVARCGALGDRLSLCKLSREGSYSAVGQMIICAASSGSIESVMDVDVERDSCSRQRCENNANLVPRSSSFMPKI